MGRKPTEKTAHNYEMAFIAAIGRGRNGPLLNLTDGGDGAEHHNQRAAANHYHNAAKMTDLKP
jgi:hypothetical protein